MTDRIPLDHLTSDQLDQLYTERDRLQIANRALNTAVVETMERAERAEAERDLLARTIAATSKQTVAQVLADVRTALGEPAAGPAATEATEPAQLAAAIARVRGYVEHALAVDGPGIGLSPGHILTLLDSDPMRTRATEAEHEAIRQMDADPHGLNAGMIVRPYRDHGEKKWVFRCWGTDTCDGFLSLDHFSEQSAQRARDRHVAEEHPEEQPGP